MKTHARTEFSGSIAPRKKFVFNLIVFSLPVLFFVVLEVFLRTVNYGPDLSLFRIETINGKAYYTFNPSVKSRYFSRVDFSPDPSPERFLVSKPPATFRIFCLGGSTTVGYPYWYNGAFSSFLRDRLKAMFPDRPIEIVNVGMTATDSYTVLDLTGDLMNYQPDLLIVYDGHNEFYGALGAASNDRVASARWITLLYLRMVHLRTFQLVKSAVSWLGGAPGKSPVQNQTRATMMEQVARGETVPFGSEMYLRALNTFRQNLEDIRDICRNHHVPLILGTQVSNLRDQSPFISGHAAGISSDAQDRFMKYYDAARELQTRGSPDSAAVLFRSAIGTDSLYADAHFRLAQCLDKEGRRNEAFREYILARDLDELRFRTDSGFNRLILSMEDHKECFIADIEKAFESASPDSLVGRNLLLEHLHPNARGEFLIAKEYSRVMREHGLLAPPGEWAGRDTIGDDILFENRHLTEVDELMADRKIEFLTSGWPFRSNTVAVTPVQPSDTLRYIADEAVHDRIGWVTAHSLAAQYYVRGLDFGNARREYETIINQLPLEVGPYLMLARLYFNQGLFPQADSVLLASLRIAETSGAYRALGDVCMRERKTDDAVSYYEKMMSLPQDPDTAPENACVLAIAYLMTNKHEQAVTLLEETANRYPSYSPARQLLLRATGQGIPGR